MNKDKSKPKIKLIIILVVVAVIIVAIVFWLNKVRIEHNKAYVQPVSDLNMGMMNYNSSMSGMISNENAQDITVDAGKVIQNVYVHEGDTVTPGTVLFTYDRNALSDELAAANLVYESDKATLDIQKELLEFYKKVEPRKDQTDEEAEEEYKKLQREFMYDVLKKEFPGLSNDAISYYIGKYQGSQESTEDTGSKKTGTSTPGSGSSTDPDDSGFPPTAPGFPSPDSATVFGQIDENIGIIAEKIAKILEEEGKKMTKAEKEAAIKESERTIRDMEGTLRQDELSLKTLKQNITDCEVKALVPGIVKSVGDPANPTNNGKPFISIGADSGYTVVGYMNEFDILKAKLEDKVNVTSYMTMTTATAVITELSYYPTNDPNMGGGMQNSSYYRFKAYLESGEGFNLNDGVDISKVPETDGGDIITLEKIYIRNDKDGNYAMVDNGNGKLERKSVKIAPTSDSEFVQIVSGLTQEDLIAFPYGKKSKAGTKTTTEYSTSIFDIF